MFRKTLCITLGSATLLFAVPAGTSGANAVRAANETQPVPAQLGTLTGGAAVDRALDVLTLSQQAQVQRKLAAQQAFLALHPAAPDYQSGNWYYSNNYLLKPEPNDSNSWASGWSAGWYYNATRTNLGASLAFPPSYPGYDHAFYYDLCGPGASTFTARSWSLSAVENYSNTSGDGEGLHSAAYNGNQVYGWGWGWYGYLYEAAYWELNSSDLTDWHQLRDFLTNNDNGTNTFWADPNDMGRTSLTYPHFTADVYADLGSFGGAVVASVDTSNMPEWSYGVSHFVPINGWNTSTSYVNWVDTAYQSGKGPGGNTFGNYNESGSAFYNPIMGSLSSQNVLW